MQGCIRRTFYGEAMGKVAFMLLGTGVLFAIIIIMIAAVDEYLRNHNG